MIIRVFLSWYIFQLLGKHSLLYNTFQSDINSQISIWLRKTGALSKTRGRAERRCCRNCCCWSQLIFQLSAHWRDTWRLSGRKWHIPLCPVAVHLRQRKRRQVCLSSPHVWWVLWSVSLDWTIGTQRNVRTQKLRTRWSYTLMEFPVAFCRQSPRCNTSNHLEATNIRN